jgi:hypothetical protein
MNERTIESMSYRPDPNFETASKGYRDRGTNSVPSQERASIAA